MAFNREAALAEGYTEDEINAYMQAEAEKNKEATPVTADPGEPPAPQTKIQPVAPTPESMGTTAGLAVAPYALPAAAALGAGAVGGKVYQGWKSGVDAANQYTATQAANAQTHAATQELKTLQQIAKGNGPEAEAAKQRIEAIIRTRPTPGMGGAASGMGSAGSAGSAASGMAGAAQPASMSSRVQAAAANMVKNLPGANSAVGKMAGKVLPGAGTALNAYDAYERAKSGDYVGAGISGVGAAASPFPVIGTAVGLGTGALNAYRDYRKQQEEEEKRRMMK